MNGNPEPLVSTTQPSGKYVATRLTPPSGGAIASIVVQGAAASSWIKDVFEPRQRAARSQVPIARPVLGRWRHPSGAIEEVVVASDGKSSLEIHCHGGSAAVEGILESLRGKGAEIVPWEVWLTYQDWDSTRRTAAALLPLARSERTALLLLDQWNGALTRTVTNLMAAVRRHRMHAEDGPSDPRARDVSEIAEQLTELRDSYFWGRHLADPWRIIVGGPPNVGKSSLINRWLGFPRALVYDQPGTTRDILRGQTVLDGWLVEFCDTAGWHVASGDLEREGIARGQNAWNDADLRILVADATRSATPPPCDPHLRSPELLLWNKCDLAPPPTQPSVPPNCCHVSALTGAGCGDVLTQIGRMLQWHLPGRETPLLISSDQHLAVDWAIRAWENGSPEETERAIRELVSI